MTTVANIRDTRDGIYIGRAAPRLGLKRSIWANPFKIGPDGSRAEVIAKYEAYLRARPELLALIPELKGKTLLCYCAPEPCHGDVLARLADESEG